MSEDKILTPGEEEANKDTPENNSAPQAEAPKEETPQPTTSESSEDEATVSATDDVSSEAATPDPVSDDVAAAEETPAPESTDAAPVAEPADSQEETAEAPEAPTAETEEGKDEVSAEVVAVKEQAPAEPEVEAPTASPEIAAEAEESAALETQANEVSSDANVEASNDAPAPKEVQDEPQAVETEIVGEAPQEDISEKHIVEVAPGIDLAEELPVGESSEPQAEVLQPEAEQAPVATHSSETAVQSPAETGTDEPTDGTDASAEGEPASEAPVEAAGPVSESTFTEAAESSESAVVEEEPEEEIDYSNHSREELAEVVDELSKQDNFKRSDNVLSKVLPLFKAMARARRQEAMEKFLADGGAQDDFEYRHDDVFNRFDASVRLIRDRRSSYYKEREAKKEENYNKKLELLDKLRDLIDGENATTNLSPIKAIQEEWKAVGSVPAQHNRTLWANFNALLDRFYNNRNILFELKELDRKKNLVKKTELCEKAEALDKLGNIKDAIIQLNEFHEEYKKIGAVPRDVQETLWQRFKAASDAIYKKRKSYLEDLKGELQQNLEKKKALADELRPYLDFNSDRINEWNAKTKEILAIQKKWDTLGGLPREYAKDVNKAFWGAFKGFFSRKNAFFKKLEGMRHENLQKKEELVAKAEEFANSTEWDKTSEALKGLQRQWKEIGPVPEKHRNSVYAKFKEACDAFFNNRRASQNKAEEQFVENQKFKEELIKEVVERAARGDGEANELDDIMTRWNAIGFVPRSAIKSVETKFAKALEAFVQSLKVQDEEREALVMKAELNSLTKGPNSDRRLNKKESDLRRKVKETEDSIAQMTNNLAFFANSKGADKLREEYDQKIVAAEEELVQLKKQLRMVRSM